MTVGAGLPRPYNVARVQLKTAVKQCHRLVLLLVSKYKMRLCGSGMTKQDWGKYLILQLDLHHKLLGLVKPERKRHRQLAHQSQLIWGSVVVLEDVFSHQYSTNELLKKLQHNYCLIYSNL